MIIFCLSSFSAVNQGTIGVFFNDPSTNPNASGILSYNLQSNLCGRRICTSLNNLGQGPYGAQDVLNILAYNLNDSSITASIINAARKGVTIQILLNEGNLENPLMRQVREFNRTEVPANPQLLKRIQIKTLRGRGNYGAMHHKVIYMTSHYRREVVWGSFNFSNNAAKYNYENCARISQPMGVNNDQLTQVLDDFSGKFIALWALGNPAGPNYYQ